MPVVYILYVISKICYSSGDFMLAGGVLVGIFSVFTTDSIKNRIKARNSGETTKGVRNYEPFIYHYAS